MPAGLSQITQSNFPHLVDDVADALFSQRILVAGLRGRQQPQGLEPFVTDERLRQLRDALDDVDEVEYDPAFCSHHEIKVTQSDVEIDDRDLLPGLRQRGAERGGRRRLADAALARRDHENLGHV